MVSTKKLSDRQKNILKYIEEYVDERGYPPSIREIGDKVGISSTSVVDYNLRVLEREGRISAAILRNGELHPEAFMQWMRSNCALQLRQRLAMTAEIEEGIDTAFVGHDIESVPTARGLVGPRCAGKLSEWRTAPQAKRLIEQGESLGIVVLGHRP